MVECCQTGLKNGPLLRSESFLSSLHLDGELEGLEIANKINSAFQPLMPVAAHEDDAFVLSVFESAVLATLKQLNPRKAAGLDLTGSFESMQRLSLNRNGNTQLQL